MYNRDKERLYMIQYLSYIRYKRHLKTIKNILLTFWQTVRFAYFISLYTVFYNYRKSNLITNIEVVFSSSIVLLNQDMIVNSVKSFIL